MIMGETLGFSFGSFSQLQPSENLLGREEVDVVHVVWEEELTKN